VGVGVGGYMIEGFVVISVVIFTVDAVNRHLTIRRNLRF